MSQTTPLYPDLLRVKHMEKMPQVAHWIFRAKSQHQWITLCSQCL